jgi:hypothetical protein
MKKVKFALEQTLKAQTVPIEKEARWTPQPVWTTYRRGKSLSLPRNRTAIPWVSTLQPSHYTDYTINAEIPHSCLVGLPDPEHGGTIFLRNISNY